MEKIINDDSFEDDEDLQRVDKHQEESFTRDHDDWSIKNIDYNTNIWYKTNKLGSLMLPRI